MFSIPVVAFLIFIGWLLKEWIGVRIDKSIQHEYDKKLEEYKFSQLQREKAELVAKLFAHWIKYRGEEEQFLNKEQLINYYEELNQMSLEVSLWMKDTEILNKIMDRLEMKENAETVHKIAGEVRTLILGQSGGFDSNKIILWPKLDDVSRIFNKKK